ncbi:MAG: IclR family transcriptional regulator [Trueperaceae bacterium]
MQHANDDQKYVVQTLARALRILWGMAARNDGWTLEELAREHDVNKASLLRILRTFENDGVILRENQRYRLGPRVLDLGYGYLNGLEVDTAARPYMGRLAAATGQTVSVAVLDGLDVVYIAFEKANRELGILDEIGGRHPANATALGKVLLADLEPDALDRTIDGRELPRLTHRTVHTRDALAAQLERVRSQGYAIDDEERGIGIRCVAAPIRDAGGRVIAGISVSGAIFHMTDDVLTEHARKVRDAAEEISERLGYVPGRGTARPGQKARPVVTADEGGRSITAKGLGD